MSSKKAGEPSLSHFHCIVLEGVIDEAGAFHHIPIKDTARLPEVFRRSVDEGVATGVTALVTHCGRV